MLDIEKLAAAGSVGSLARELARLEDHHVSWRTALSRADSLSKQWPQLPKIGSEYVQLARDLQSPAVTLASQYSALFGEGTAAMQAMRQWQAVCQEQQASIRKMLEPLAGIRKGLIAVESTHRIAKEFSGFGAIAENLRRALDQTSVLGPVARVGTLQLEAKAIFERAAIGSNLQSYLKAFERVNKQWKVPSEVLGFTGALKDLQEQFGRVSLPTIDWSSAGALAHLLGREGLEGQLAHLGINPDGTLHETAELPEKGLLSRKQADALVILSLLLTLLFFIYQELSSQQGKREVDEFQAKTSQMLESQANQIHGLTVLLERALISAAQAHDERFVVRERIATVRLKPAHGAAVEGKLLPNEVVKALDKKGKWVEVEYYHWLHEEYRTGWVLKKYLERVPANYQNEN